MKVSYATLHYFKINNNTIMLSKQGPWKSYRFNETINLNWHLDKSHPPWLQLHKSVWSCQRFLLVAWPRPTLHVLSAAVWCGRCRSRSGPGLPPGTGNCLPLPRLRPHHCALHWPLSARLDWMSILALKKKKIKSNLCSFSVVSCMNTACRYKTDN